MLISKVRQITKETLQACLFVDLQNKYLCSILLGILYRIFDILNNKINEIESNLHCLKKYAY